MSEETEIAGEVLCCSQIAHQPKYKQRGGMIARSKWKDGTTKRAMEAYEEMRLQLALLGFDEYGPLSVHRGQDGGLWSGRGEYIVIVKVIPNHPKVQWHMQWLGFQSAFNASTSGSNTYTTWEVLMLRLFELIEVMENG